MGEHLLIGLAGIIVLGVSAQWLAWRLNLPSILLLLLFGFVAGPLTGFIDPDHMFGETLFPAVSLAVGVILFEGGLTLKLDEMSGAGTRGVVYRFITVGVAVTWAIGMVAGHYLLGLSWPIAALLGAILVVSGPTVVLPLLRFIRPTTRVASILKWEGILIDPVGATLAVLVFESMLGEGFVAMTPLGILGGIFLTLLEGGIVGMLGAVMFVVVLERQWVPEYLETSVSLMIVLAVFAGANAIIEESGLMAATIMGVILANQKRVSVKNIVTFKEELGVLLLSALFIVLAARLRIEDILSIGWLELGFLGILVFVARPLSAFVSTIRSGLPWQERLFLAWLAPRGIVAASVASLFAIHLTESNVPGAERLVPLTFLVVVGTVAVYALTTSPLAARLGIQQEHPQGTLIVGAHGWARQLAHALSRTGYLVVLVDSNGANVRVAHEEGLTAVQGNVLSNALLDDLTLSQMGQLLAVTPNPELNALAAVHFMERLGKENVFQIAAPRNQNKQGALHGPGGRVLFSTEMTFQSLSQWFREGEVQQVFLTERQSYESFLERQEQVDILPLFVLDGRGEINIYSPETGETPQAGQALTYLSRTAVAVPSA